MNFFLSFLCYYLIQNCMETSVRLFGRLQCFRINFFLSLFHVSTWFQLVFGNLNLYLSHSHLFPNIGYTFHQSRWSHTYTHNNTVAISTWLLRRYFGVDFEWGIGLEEDHKGHNPMWVEPIQLENRQDRDHYPLPRNRMPRSCSEWRNGSWGGGYGSSREFDSST